MLNSFKWWWRLRGWFNKYFPAYPQQKSLAIRERNGRYFFYTEKDWPSWDDQVNMKEGA